MWPMPPTRSGWPSPWQAEKGRAEEVGARRAIEVPMRQQLVWMGAPAAELPSREGALSLSALPSSPSHSHP